MAKIISLFNHKGGVGKTTVAHNLGACLSKLGKKILLIDADPQMNLTSSVLGLADSVEYADVNESKWQEARSKYTNINGYLTSYLKEDETRVNLYPDNNANLRLLCGDINIFKLESRLYNIVTSKVNKDDLTAYKIEKAIRELGKDCDYIIIDTSPSSNSIINGIMVMMSDYFICPVFPNFFSLQAIDNLAEVLKNWISLLSDFRTTTNNKGLSFSPKFLGAIINMAKRFENEDGSKVTIYAENWREKLNESIKKFYQQSLDLERTVTREEFKKIFDESEPFIIKELCDFTGQIRNIAEIAGIPVVNLTNDTVKATVNKVNNRTLKINGLSNIKEAKSKKVRIMTQFSVTKTAKSKDSHYTQAFNNVTESYEYVAKCLSKL